MGTCLSIGRGRQDVGVKCVPCATVSAEQDTAKEEDDEGDVSNDMHMNNNNTNNMNNNNHGAAEGAFVPSFLVSSPEYVSTGMLRGG